jgi:hypothetical protein
MNEFYTQVQGGELNGFAPVRNRQREEAVASAVALYADVKAGRVPSYLFMEALSPRTPAVVRSLAAHYPGLITVTETMTRSDFPLLIGDVIDRILLARWGDFPQAWRAYAAVVTRRDFRSGRAVNVDGLEGAWPEQSEEEELEYGALTEAGYLYAIKKYALGAKLSFELFMNDDLDAIETIPSRLARGGQRTINRYVADLWLDANGPDATAFTTGNGSRLTGNPPLSITSLATAFGALRGRLDAQGEPILVERAVLVVPPALEVTARNIVNATEIRMTNLGGASGQEIRGANWLAGSLQIAVDPYIPIIASTANGNTTWGLFADPNTGQPAIEVAFLRGFEQPRLYQKVSNTAAIGGGVVQEMGDWDTMATALKGVVAFGGTLLSNKALVVSNGSGA